MKNLNTKIMVLSVALGLGSTAPAWSAEGSQASFGVVGAVTVQNPSFSHNGSSEKVKGKFGFGGGLTLELPVVSALSFETDLLFLSHKFSRDTADFFGTNVSSTVTSGYMHIPVILRYHLLPILSVGAGAYYSRIIKNWTASASGLGNVSANYGKNDSGWLVVAGVDIPLGGIDLAVDARFARSLSNAARNSGDTLKFAELQALAGVKFAF
jgi:hypothetical protein